MIEGIDLSRNNDFDKNGKEVWPDPAQVIASGRLYVVHKLTDGVGSPDPSAARNVTLFSAAVAKAGIPFAHGAYHFLRVRHGRPQDARQQAQEFCRRMTQLGAVFKFMWFDIELEGLEKIAQEILLATTPDHAAIAAVQAEVADAVLQFRDEYQSIVSAGGQVLPQTFVDYCSPGEDGILNLGNIHELSDDELALAAYTTNMNPTPPEPWKSAGKDWLFHQYAADVGNIGSCPGIASPHCDLSRFKGTIDDLLGLG